MAASYYVCVMLLSSFVAGCACACEVYARTNRGLVCGALRRDVRGRAYASFRGVPYVGDQPTEDRRFQPLHSVEPSDHINATQEGPICPQYDVFYGSLMDNHWMSEACLHANVHVPEGALPELTSRPARHLQPPFTVGYREADANLGLPIIVFIHGGGFAFGSGDADVYGPEYLVAENVIVVTFNYRLNVFGFLSLNSASVPGNNGLRDAISLLRWVRHNARYFGGDATRVTLAGQSAGASAAHLLALSPAAKGLFQRVITMSGTAIPSFYTTSPAYAQLMAGQFASLLGINSTDPDDIHSQLVQKPLKDIMDANKELEDQTGIVVFLPVIESKHHGVTAVLDFDTEAAIAKGRDSQVPMIVGYTTNECETFRPRFEEINILASIEANPLLVLSPNLIFSYPTDVALEKANIVKKKYFKGKPTMDEFIQLCSDTYYKYPALKVASYRVKNGGGPLYLYEFGYTADENAIKSARNLTYEGAGHAEDLTYLFKINSVKVQHSTQDLKIRELITTLLSNFIRNGSPTVDNTWLPVDSSGIKYLRIRSPDDIHISTMSEDQREILQFFDSLQPNHKHD